MQMMEMEVDILGSFFRIWITRLVLQENNEILYRSIAL